MKQPYFLILLLCVIMTACGNEEVQFNGGSLNSGSTISGDSVVVNVPDTIELSVDTFYSNAVRIVYSGTSAVYSSLPDGVRLYVNGGDVTVVSTIDSVVYQLSGSATDGSFKIYSDHAFGIALNGVNLTNVNSPAINIQSKKAAYITIGAGTENALVDGSSYVTALDVVTVDAVSSLRSATVTEDEDMKACLFSEGQLIFSGSGHLDITGNYKHAICSDDYICVAGGDITIKAAVSDGIHANDYFYMIDGSLDITCDGDAIDCEEGWLDVAGGNIDITTSQEKAHGMKAEGNVLIEGGTVTVNVSGSASKGIKSAGSFMMTDGTLSVTTTGAAIYDSDDADISSPAGINADGGVSISGDNTVITLKSSGKAGKGISTDGALVISGGTISVTTTGKQYTYGNLDSSPKGIKSEGNLTINGGFVTVSTTGGEGSEGIESKSVLTINGGTVEVTAYDDCINSAGAMVINGGKIYCYASNNDGMDSNSTMTITGGLIVSSGTTSPEEGIDCDQNTFKITGGTIIGIGGATSTPTSGVTTQYTIVYGGTGSANTYFHIQDANANDILTYKIPRAYTQQMTLLFSSADMTSGSTYYIYTGGSVSGGTDFHGYNTGGTYSSGTQSTSFTLNSVVTTVGSSSGGGGGNTPGGGGGRPGF